MNKYRRFKEIVPSIAEEKTYFREFEKESGYASFPIIKKMKEQTDESIIKGIKILSFLKYRRESFLILYWSSFYKLVVNCSNVFFC